MIIEGSTFGALAFLIIGLFGISLGGIVKGLFGGGSKTDSNASYEKFLQKQEQQQRDHENRMAQIAAAQAKKTGMTISPIMIFGGVAVVAMVFLPQMMGRR